MRDDARKGDLVSSQRRLIRDKVIDILTGITGVANAGAAVFGNRSKKVYPEEMPALIVYTRNEQAEIEVAAPRSYKRVLRLAVEVITDTKDDDARPDDVVDELCAEIERRLFLDETLSGLAADLRLSDTEMETNSDGETQHAAARITFEVDYWTDAPEEQTGLDDFLRVHSSMKVTGGVDDTVPATDDVTIVQPPD